MAPRQIAEAIVQNVPKTALIENVSGNDVPTPPFTVILWKLVLSFLI